jgi:hypothetical protein
MRKYSSISLSSRVGTAVSLTFSSSENARPWLAGMVPVGGIGSTGNSSIKFGVPRPVTYATQSQPTKKQSLVGGRTGSHPGTAVNPSVPQPGLLPDVMSVMPGIARPYNQGLRKPSWGLPCVSKKSLSSATMPATTFALAISWMDDVEWGRRVLRRTGAAALVPLTVNGWPFMAIA